MINVLVPLGTVGEKEKEYEKLFFDSSLAKDGRMGA